MVCGLAAVAALASCSEDPGPGIEVSVDLAEFASVTGLLTVAISASPDGFMPYSGGSVNNVGVKTEDVDGDGTLELVTTFISPRSTVTFRVDARNMAMLDVSGHATAFDETAVIAGADSDAAASLSPGGRKTIALKLTERPGGIVGPMTHTTDIKTLPADITVQTAQLASFSSVAVCDVDGDGTGDLVLGAPIVNNMNLLAAGAVYVLLGKNGFGSTLDPTNEAAVTAFHFLGEASGDQLGTTVACADLNNDPFDDLIVAAPNAGRIYAVFGNPGILTQRITPGSTGTDAPDVTWQTIPGAGFGNSLFVDDLNGDGNAEILVAAPGQPTRKVHLLKNVTARTPTPINVDVADHVIFSNVSATALAAGNLRHATGGVDVVIGDSDGKRPTAVAGGGAVYAFADVKLNGTTQYDALSTDAATGRTTVIYGEDNALFGAALLALDTTGNGPDLIVGAPGTMNAAGALYLYKNDNNIFGVAERAFDDHVVAMYGPIAFGRFGSALAGTPTGNPGLYGWDLIVGAPSTPRTTERQSVGAAYRFGGTGTTAWSFPLTEQVYGATATDQLGSVVAGGQLGAGNVGDLVTIATNAMTGDNPGIVYVVYGPQRN
jgi:hypothetical protein